MTYTLTNGADVIRDADNALIPADPANRDRAEYEAWLADGGVPEPVPARQLTLDDYEAAIDALVQAAAQSKGYSSAVSCVSYEPSGMPLWKAQAQTFIAWRDAVWLAVYATLAAVQNGEMAPPSVEGLISSLPAIVWPA